VFIILVASALGTAIPIVSKHVESLGVPPYFVCLGKTMGTGVVIACGLIHMLQPSNQSLTSPCLPWEFTTDYPCYAYLYAMLSGLMMHFLDFVFTQYFEARQAALTHTQSDKSSCGSIESISEFNTVADEPQSQMDHGHSHASLLTINNEWDTKKLIEAYMIEVGVTTHSLFVGLAVGVTDYNTLLVLLVAFVFHQFFEGVALGARVADARLSVFNELMMSTVFSIAAPLGIGIGIGVYNSLNTNGETFLMIQGTFDGICAGILLYTGYSLLMMDFPRDIAFHCVGKHKRLMQFFMFAFLWTGAGVMAFIGKYL